jgi:hypothetical protein
MQTAVPLSRIDECPELLVDGFAADLDSSLVFLSVWGNDSYIQAFLARLTLPKHPRGLKSFHLVPPGSPAISVEVGNPEQLDKRLARVPRSYFGTLAHLWLFDRRCVLPDKANARAFALLNHSDHEQEEAVLWQRVQETCPLPLLPHWRGVVHHALRKHGMLVPLLAFGPVRGWRLALELPVLQHAISNQIRAGILTCADAPAQRPLPQAA